MGLQKSEIEVEAPENWGAPRYLFVMRHAKCHQWKKRNEAE